MQALVIQAIFAILGAREVPADLPARYARALENVVATEQSHYSGRHAAEKSALLDLAVAYQESAIDWLRIEECTFRTDHGWQDFGRAIGIFQIHLDSAGIGYKKADVCGDVELQIRLGHRYLAKQVKRCGGNVERALTMYNGGGACMASIYSASVLRTYRALVARFGL